MDPEQRRAQAAVALLTAWLEDEGWHVGIPATLVADSIAALAEADDISGALEGALALVAGLTYVAGQLLIRSAHGHGTTEEQGLQSLSLLFA